VITTTRELFSSAVSCRARVEQFIPQKISQDFSPPHVSQGVPHWVHVFAKSTASTSLRTQCASIAHNLPTISSSAKNARKRRLRNKFKRQQRLLHEIIIPEDQFKLTVQEVDEEVIVFDGGNIDNPPILPPDGVIWWSISTSQLHKSILTLD
jgi:hypothetical protein